MEEGGRKMERRRKERRDTKGGGGRKKRGKRRVRKTIGREWQMEGIKETRKEGNEREGREEKEIS